MSLPPEASAAPAASPTPPVPTVPPSAPPPTPPATPPAGGMREVTKADVHGLFQRLADTTEEEPQDQKKKDPPAPEGKKPKEGDPAAPPATPPIKVAKKAALAKRPELPKNAPAPAAAAPPQVPAAKPEPAAPADDSDLLDNEREMISDAKLVEETLGDKHKGLEAKTRKFVRDHAKYLEDHPEADDNENPQAQQDYRKWLTENQPKLSPADIRRANEERIVKRASGAQSEEVQSLRHELFVRDETPKVQQQVSGYREKMFATALPDEILAIFNDKKHGGDYSKAAKEAHALYGDEIGVASQIINLATKDIEEFIRIGTVNKANGKSLSSTPTAAEPDRMAQHERISMMVDELCNDFKNTASEKELVRDGRWYVTRAEWYTIPAAQRSGFWTFDNKQLIERAISGLKSTVALGIKNTQEQMKQRGYTRVRPSASAAPDQPPPTGGSPAPRPSPVPGERAPAGGSGASTEASKLASQLNSD